MSNAPHVAINPTAFWRDPYPALAAMRREHPIAYVPQLGATLFTRRTHIVELEKLTDAQRSAHLFPKRGTMAPWKLKQDYIHDLLTPRWGKVDDGAMVFSNPVVPEQQALAAAE